MVYGAVNRPVLPLVPRSTRRLLDLGCGSGALGRQIKQEIECEVVGITCSVEEAALATECLDSVLVRDLNAFDPGVLGRFDCIICSHVLEHLHEPQDLLRRLRQNLVQGGGNAAAVA